MGKAATTKESDVLIECRALLDFLRAQKLLDYWRVSIGGVLRGGKFLTPNKEMAGFSDIIILLPIPRALFLELKAENGRQSDNQKEFQKRIEATNHKYYLCRSRGELCEILEANGVPMKIFIR